MSITLKESIKKLPPDRQAKIAARAQQLINEELSLRELRKARELSQEEMSERLKMRQGDISKLERRTDLYLSTVRKFVQALGGTLELVVTFPDSGPVRIAQIGADEDRHSRTTVNSRKTKPRRKTSPRKKKRA
jgi:transcriptional regulator with XRE-family HTH domain